MKKSVQITLGVLAAAIVAVALVFGVKALLPKGDSGEKSISIQVVVSEEDVREFTVNTTEEFLGPALEMKGSSRAKTANTAFSSPRWTA